MQTTTHISAQNRTNGELDLLDQLSLLKPGAYRFFVELKQRLDKNNVAQRVISDKLSTNNYTRRLINELREKELIRFVPTVPFTNDPHLTYPRHSVMLNPYLLIPVDAERVQEIWEDLKFIKS